MRSSTDTLKTFMPKWPDRTVHNKAQFLSRPDRPNGTISPMPPVCALCRTNSDLQNSHIIPEFFYRLIYDAKPRRFHVVSANPSEREQFGRRGQTIYLLVSELVTTGFGVRLTFMQGSIGAVLKHLTIRLKQRAAQCQLMVLAYKAWLRRPGLAFCPWWRADSEYHQPCALSISSLVEG